MARRTAAAEAAARFHLGSSRAWARALGVLAVLSFVAAIPLSLLAHQVGNGVIGAGIGIPCAAIGMLVTRRQRENPLGWLFLVIGVCLFLCTDGAAYATLRYRLGHRLPLGQVGLVLNQIWGPSLVLFVVAVLLFPDGRLTSQFWRWTFRVYGVLFGVLLAATAVAIAGALSAHPVFVDTNGGLAAVDQPAGWFAVVQSLLIVSMLGLSLAFIARLALSWRRATGERRQQLKWLAAGATVSLVCLGLAGTFSSSDNGPTLRGVLTGIAWLGVAALPVSIGVAIMKYRLYDIDRIISRTLAYAIITGLLAGVYAGLVLLITQVFGVHTPVAVAASTLAGGAVQPAAAAGPASGGPAVQPGPV